MSIVALVLIALVALLHVYFLVLEMFLWTKPLGLKTSDPMPCDVARMDAHAALVDILMKNQPSPMVRAARARGLAAFPGFEMMIQQAHLYLDFFGLHDAARHVRRDAGFIRQRIYPAELVRETQLFQPPEETFP